jgi:hypothetical protein
MGGKFLYLQLIPKFISEFKLLTKLENVTALVVHIKSKPIFICILYV